MRVSSYLRSNSQCHIHAATTHLQQGSCSIQFDASGKYVEEHTTELWFRPDDIRHMAGWVIDQCVDGEKLGGFVTKGIASTTSYLSAPSTKILDELRKQITPFLVTLFSSKISQGRKD